MNLEYEENEIETEKVSEQMYDDKMDLQQQIVEHMHKLNDSFQYLNQEQYHKKQKEYSGVGPFSEMISTERNGNSSPELSLEKHRLTINTEEHSNLESNSKSRERIRYAKIKLESFDSHEDHLIKWQKDMRKSSVIIKQQKIEKAARKIQKFFKKMLAKKQKISKKFSREKFERYETGSFGKYDLDRNAFGDFDKVPYGGLYIFLIHFLTNFI